jgi:hypothetical protein
MWVVLVCRFFWHSSRASTASYRYHCKLGPNTVLKVCDVVRELQCIRDTVQHLATPPRQVVACFLQLHAYVLIVSSMYLVYLPMHRRWWVHSLVPVMLLTFTFHYCRCCGMHLHQCRPLLHRNLSAVLVCGRWFALEDGIGSHDCSLEALACAWLWYASRVFALVPVDTVNICPSTEGPPSWRLPFS